MTTSKKQLTINGLLACGWREIQPSPSRKYRAFSGGSPESGRMFVGGSGALRWSPTGTVGGAVSITGTARHRAYQEIGNPAIRWESPDQAIAAYHRIQQGKPIL